MAEGRVDGDGADIPPEVPEADFLEQQVPVQPAAAGDQSVGRDAGDDSTGTEADDADRWEQQQPVPLAEDAYPPDPGPAE